MPPRQIRTASWRWASVALGELASLLEHNGFAVVLQPFSSLWQPPNGPEEWEQWARANQDPAVRTELLYFVLCAANFDKTTQLHADEDVYRSANYGELLEWAVHLVGDPDARFSDICQLTWVVSIDVDDDLRLRLVEHYLAANCKLRRADWINAGLTPPSVLPLDAHVKMLRTKIDVHDPIAFNADPIMRLIFTEAVRRGVDVADLTTVNMVRSSFAAKHAVATIIHWWRRCKRRRAVMDTTPFGATDVRVDMRIGALCPKYRIVFDHSYTYQGRCASDVPRTDKEAIVAEAAARTKRLLLLMTEGSMLNVTFHAGDPMAPAFLVRWSTIEPNYRMLCADPNAARVCAKNCAEPSDCWRLWWRLEVFGEYRTEAEALAYRDRSTLQLTVTPPQDTNFFYLLKFILAVRDGGA